MYNTVDPITITEERYNFAQVSDDVNAVCWLPSSCNDLLAATPDSLLICDLRASWASKKHQIEENSHKGIFGIKFDPFDKNRFATISHETIKVFDLRISCPQYVIRKT